MKDFKTIYLINAFLRAITFICITYAAVKFDNYGLLWWYIVPFFMGIEYHDGEDKNDSSN